MHDFSIRITGAFAGDPAELKDIVTDTVRILAANGRVDHASVNSHTIHVDRVEAKTDDPDQWLSEVDRKAKDAVDIDSVQRSIGANVP